MWANLLDNLQKQAEADRVAYNDADFAEGRRRKKAVEHLQDLDQKTRLTQQRSEEAIAAHSNLIADAQVTAQERALTDRNGEVNGIIAKCKDAIDPGFHSMDHRGFAVGFGGNWAHLDTHPALLVSQIRAKLEDDADSLAPERKSQLTSQLHAAENAVIDRTRELLAAQKEAAEINSKQVKLNAAKLLPENFRLVRATPTSDEQNKRLAREFGFHDGPTVTVSTER